LKQHVQDLDRLLQSGKLSKRQLTDFVTNTSELLALSETNLQRGIDIVGNFKNVAVDQSSHQKREFVVAEFLEEVLSSLGPKLKKLKVQPDIQCDRGLTLLSYPGDLFQVLTNLVINSLNHGFVDTDRPEINIKVTPEQERLCLDYMDNGCGMPEDIRLHVFEPFVTTKGHRGGSGLGMHIVHTLVTQKLKGEIKALDCSQGVHFRFCLPLAI